jgi:O-antigen/teichoic acid export membrane protein
MKSKFFQVAQNALVYGLGSVSQQIIGFLLLPLYTAHLDPDEYGRLALISAFSALLGMVLGMGISTSIFKYYFKEKNVDGKRLVISSALFWLIGLGIFSAVVMALFSGQISQVLLSSPLYAPHIQVMAFTLALTQLQVIPLGVLRAEKKSWQYALLTLSNFVFGVGLSIYLIAYLELGILGVLLANLASAAMFVLIGMFICRNMIGLHFSWTILQSLLRFGIPLIPAAVSLYVLNQADRWFLQYYHSFQDVGVYSLGYKIGSAINLAVVQPVQLIWLPIVFEMEHQADGKKFYERMLTYFFVISFWVGLALILFSEEVILFGVDSKYREAYGIIPWVVMAYIMYGAYFIVVIGVFLKNKTSYTIWIVGLAGIFNIVFDFLLIPGLAGKGAAVATLLSYIVLFILAFWVNRRVYPLEYEWARIAKVFGVFLVILFFPRVLSGYPILVAVIKAFLLLVYWVALWLTGFFDQNELAWFKALLSKARLTSA